MKKVMLFLLVAGLSLATVELSARRCGTSCAPKCAPKACAPCAPKVVEHPMEVCEAPRCSYVVEYTKPAVCHKYSYCKWVCPSDCQVEPGYDRSNLVEGTLEEEMAY